MIYYTIESVKELVKTKLEASMADLNGESRLPISFPRSIDDYKLNHSKGEILIVYKGGKFSPSKAENGVLQNRDIKIGVIAVIRKTTDNLTPEAYVEWATDALSGTELDVDRPDRFITAEEDEWLKEQNYEWWYGITFNVPVVFVEKQYREAN
ncbi:MAG: hypothetical protein HF314_12000 [Ignavibacteria bacterium]|jgi:hypothetical protein|nr:hypothetical protein [Ignavibacteria bacterium]MCU7503793.1 hypothetical protein [Ignavibacteria bacterium]MCU7517193.1 hypothetical protein [Ignavibacteria bacterium]